MNQLLQLQNELQSNFPERAEVVRGLLMGLLTGKHVLLVGPPGTGKSMLVNELADRLVGGKRFAYLMTKYTRPEEIIGAVSLKCLERDEFKRELVGKICDAHFVFLDEVFNANSACANAILTVMNEGIYYNGSEVVSVPLVALIGAANELPVETSGELAAFYDRFLLRFQVDYLQSERNLEKLLALDSDMTYSNRTEFTMDEIKHWQELVSRVEMPRAIVKKMIALVGKLRSGGLVISDRRIKESQSVLRANAFLSGREQVLDDDFEVLQNIFWQQPEERELIREQIINMATPLEKRAGKLVSEARQIKLRMDSIDTRGRRMALGGEVNIRLTAIVEELKEIVFQCEEEGLTADSASSAINEVEDIHRKIIQSCLGLAPELV